MTGSRSDLRVVPAALGGWLAAAALTECGPIWSFVVAAGALVVAGLLRHRPAIAIPAICVAVVAVGCGWRITAIESSPVTELARERSVVTAVVVARADARTFAGRAGDGTVVPVMIDEVRDRHRAWNVRVRGTAFLPGAATVVTGERLIVQAGLGPSRSSDEAAVVQVNSWSRSGGLPWWWAASEQVRSGIRVGVAHHHDQAAALVPALVAGDEAGLHDDTRADFARTGLTHLLAVSGANLTIVLGVVLVLVRPLLGRRFTLIAAFATVLAFVLVARPEPSVQRAAVMGVVAVSGLLVGAMRGGVRALAWAVLSLLVLDPWLSKQAGFVLSVCATAGIILIAPPLARRLGWLPRWAAEAVAVPCAAHLACLPVVAALSGEISLVAVAANIAAAPVVAPATIAGLVAGLVALVSPTLAWAPGTVAWAAATVIVAVARFGAATDGAAVAWNHSPWLLALLCPPAGWLGWRLAHRPAVVIGLVLALVVVIVHPPSPGWPPDDIVVVACDVGQGDGFVIPTGGDTAIVVDVGQESAPIDRCLRSLGINRIALLVFTHADADHVDGWRGAVRGREVDVVGDGPSGGPTVSGARRVRLVAGQAFRVGSAEIEVLWPPATDQQVSADQRNDFSVVLRVTTRGRRILLTGDLGEEAQRRLGRLQPDLTADVLKVAHHGSADQWPDLVERVNPSAALIGVGADNTFGHPTPTSLANLAAHGVPVWRTDLSGTVAVVSDSDRFHVVAR